MSDYETIIEELREERIRFGDRLKRIQDLLWWAVRNELVIQRAQNKRSEIGNLPHQWSKLIAAESVVYMQIMCRRLRATPLQVLQIAYFAKSNHGFN